MSILWRISRPGYPASHILGTMHISNRAAFRYIDQLTRYVLDAQLFVAETDIRAMHEKMSHPDAMHIPMGKTLHDLISPKKYKKIHQLCLKVFKLDLDTMSNMPPVLIINLLMQQLMQKDYQHSLDAHLWQIADQQGLILKGLESVEDQQEVFDQMSLQWQTKQLLSMLSNISKFRKSTRMMMQMYERQEIFKLYRYTKKQLGGMRKILLYDRNQKMLDVLLDYLPQHKCFIAVGAAHLPGYRGLLRQIKHAQYRVEAVNL